MLPAAQLVSANSLAGTLTVVVNHKCVLAAVRAINTTINDAYVQLFDAAAVAGITLGTTIPVWALLTDFGAGDVSVGDGLPTNGLVFENGIVAASTTSALGSTGASQHVKFAIL